MYLIYQIVKNNELSENNEQKFRKQYIRFICIICSCNYMQIWNYNYRKMSESIVEIKQTESKYRADIKIVGKFQTNLQQIQHLQSQNSSLQNYPIVNLESSMGIYCPELIDKPQNYKPKPKKIYAQGNVIAFIDQLDNLWFVGNSFSIPVNVSVLLGKKIKHVSLSENQCIVNNKKSPILLNWGAKKVLDIGQMENIKISQKFNKTIGSYFSGYSMEQSNKDDYFLYSNTKKVDNSNKLYHLRTQNKNQISSSTKLKKNKNKRFQQKQEIQYEQVYSIMAYPTMQKNIMRNKVIGISVGKFHCMCWDIVGLLYTWGNRSLALGFQELPHQKITTKPRLVKKMNTFVTMGFAATHYSLALSCDGNLYEWGIKKLPNKLNEELIFEPKILKVGKSSSNSKIIMLKGKEQQIACLNSKHQLFIWGEKITKNLSESFKTFYKIKSDMIYEPFQLPCLQKDKIIDFAIGNQFIAILTSHSNSIVMADEERLYWNGMLKKVRSKLKITGVKTEAAQIHQSNFQTQKLKSIKSQIQQIPTLQFFPHLRQTMSSIQKSYQQRNTKIAYFHSLKNENKFYINLLKNNKKGQNQNIYKDNGSKMKQIGNINQQSKMVTQIFQKHSSFRKSSSNSSNRFGIQSFRQNANQLKGQDNFQLKACLSQNSNYNFALNEAKSYINSIFCDTFRKATGRRKNSNQLQNILRKSQIIQHKKMNIQPYTQRLQKVIKNKKSIQNNFNMQMTKKIQQNSIQFRMQRHNEIIQAKVNAKLHNLLKNTLQSFLIKHFIAKIFTTPIQQARNIKIKQFAKSLHLSRIQKNLRSIFIKSRVSSRLKKINFQTFALLCHTFKQFVKSRREKKTMKLKKIVAEQIFKYVLRQKIRLGLSKSHLNVRKLQKFREWLVMTKVQRIKCLKVLWKNYILQIMKVNQEADITALFKTQQNCTFESLYKEKVLMNPMLKLQTFLDRSPIFQLRYEYFQSLIFLFKKDNKAKSQKILKGIKSDKRKQRIKFSGGDQKQYFIGGPSNLQFATDLLPYSLHYNLLVRHKSMEVNILQNMKKSEQWVKQQRKIFERCLNQIIQNYERNLIKARSKYDKQLAFFIKQKYDSLSQKRWKCIIEYNKLKQAPVKQRKQKRKKQKELHRLFDLIGMQKTLAQDCLPQKYLMIEEALKKRDAPVPPSPYITFGFAEFKEIFRKYYQYICIKAKQKRAKYV